MTPRKDPPEDTRFLLGSIAGKIDLVLVTMEAQRAADAERFRKIEATQEEHAGHIASLQKDRSWVLGGAAAVTGAVGTFFAYLGLKS